MSRDDELRAALAGLRAGRRAADLESTTLEFKQDGRTEGDTIKLLVDAALCFTNAGGGIVVLGVSDKGEGAAALAGTSLEAEFVQRRVHELTRPPLLVDVAALRLPEARLIALYVPAGMEVHADTQGRAPRRVATACLPMEPAEVARLRDERMGVDWSAMPTEQTSGDLSAPAFATARERLARQGEEAKRLARASERDLLRALKGVGPDGALRRAIAVLLCVSDADADPAILYQYRQTPGGEARAVERLPFPLLPAIERVLDLVRARHVAAPLNLPDGQQLTLEDFPLAAVREVVVNAAMHRDYRLAGPIVIDHSPSVMVITSPGPLVSGVTPDNIITHPSKPRNPLLASMFRALRLAEERGAGVDRVFREMIRAGHGLPRIESLPTQVRVTLVGGAPNAQVARFIAQLPADEREDTDTLLILLRLLGHRTVRAVELAPYLQKTEDEVLAVLRRVASSEVALLEPTRETATWTSPTYRLRGEALKGLGTAVTYQRRTLDDIDRKVVSHVREYGTITNRTVQNLLDVNLTRARDILADLVERAVLIKVSSHQRGPGVEYGAGRSFPAPRPKRGRQMPLKLK